MTAGIKRTAPDGGFDLPSGIDADDLFYKLDKLPLGSWSEDSLRYICKSLSPPENNWAHSYRLGVDVSKWEDGDNWPKEYRDHHYVSLRIGCELYAKCRNSPKREELLKRIEKLILLLNENKFSPSGVGLPYTSINKFSLVRRAYEFEDAPLTALFSKHFPIPSSAYFIGQNIPAFIYKKEEETNAVLKSFLEKNKEFDFRAIEKNILTIQRIFRSACRKNEESHRLRKADATLVTPLYVPKCDPALSVRIIRLALQVKFLESIRHITTKSALVSIFDGALYGRKSLLRNYIPFSDAALDWPDIENGDADVICFGAKQGLIDPMADGNVEFILNLEKMDFGKNYGAHCAFFKQRDFLFFDDDSELPEEVLIRSLKISPEKKFLFKNFYPINKGMNFFTCKYENGEDFYRDSLDNGNGLPLTELVSYDIANINAVFILNFFKLLDTVTDDTIINEFYSDLQGMADERLLALLKEIGENISFTMEFNFYGAHQIDFASLEYVREREQNFSLHLPSLIQELQSGKLDLYKKAFSLLPTLFQSYRFLDYLIAKIENPEMRKILEDLRKLCDPLFRSEIGSFLTYSKKLATIYTYDSTQAVF